MRYLRREKRLGDCFNSRYFNALKQIFRQAEHAACAFRNSARQPAGLHQKMIGIKPCGDDFGYIKSIGIAGVNSRLSDMCGTSHLPAAGHQPEKTLKSHSTSGGSA